jgi:glycosyltransferase involved in cell wall biosynthesis
MRVIHVIPSITEEAAGPSYSVPRLCESLIDNDVELELVALGSVNITTNLPYLKTFPLGLGPKRLGISPKMRNWLKQEVKSGHADIIHNHSLWMMPNVYPLSAVRGSKCPLVVSPRGTLSKYALNRSALQKKIFWYLLQASVLREAKCLHATAESEYEDIRRLGFKQPVCILPNGIDVPPLVEKVSGGRKQLLFFGRIHPIKGIDNLLHAWQAVEHRYPEWDLHIAGPDNGGYLAEMQALAKELQLTRVVFAGPLFGDDKLRAYRKANLYVLPSHSENFGMTVAESLAAGTPAIVTKGAPWGGLEEEKAGWWVDIGVEPLVTCLEEALVLTSNQLGSMGHSGREWMLRDFSWVSVGEQFKITYQWLLDGGKTPPWVRLN